MQPWASMNETYFAGNFISLWDLSFVVCLPKSELEQVVHDWPFDCPAFDRAFSYRLSDIITFSNPLKVHHANKWSCRILVNKSSPWIVKTSSYGVVERELRIYLWSVVVAMDSCPPRLWPARLTAGCPADDRPLRMLFGGRGGGGAPLGALTMKPGEGRASIELTKPA